MLVHAHGRYRMHGSLHVPQVARYPVKNRRNITNVTPTTTYSNVKGISSWLYTVVKASNSQLSDSTLFPWPMLTIGSIKLNPTPSSTAVMEPSPTTSNSAWAGI